MAAWVVALVASDGPTSGVELVRLVGSETAVPGWSDTFFLDAIRPTACELGVVFSGRREAEFAFSGLYVVTSEGIDVLLDESTPVPDGVGTFDEVVQPHCEGRRVAFQAKDSGTGRVGIYEWNDGLIGTIANTEVDLPETDYPLQGMSQPVVEKQRTAFKGTESITAIAAIYLSEDGVVHEVVEEGDGVPGSGLTLVSFGTVDASQEVVFRALYSSFEWGILATSGNTLRRVADGRTPVPDGSISEFSRFGGLATSGHRIVFTADDGFGASGLYIEDQGLLRTLLPYLAAVPGAGRLRFYGEVDFDDDSVAFQGSEEGSAARERLYLLSDGALTEVLAMGDVLDGKRVGRFLFRLEHSTLVVWVLFEDSSQAIYAGAVARRPTVVDVPSLRPFVLALLVVGLAAAGTLLARTGFGRDRIGKS